MAEDKTGRNGISDVLGSRPAAALGQSWHAPFCLGFALRVSGRCAPFFLWSIGAHGVARQLYREANRGRKKQCAAVHGEDGPTGKDPAGGPRKNVSGGVTLDETSG